MKRYKVLVTGANGFLGSHICDSLHDSGCEVHALVRQTSSLQWLRHEWLTIHKVDFADHGAISEILKQVDYVIHSAGALASAARGKEEAMLTNVEVTRMLAEESVNKGIKRFIFTSSLAAGGPGTGPQARTEQDHDNPVSFYGRSKKEAEQMLASMSKRLFTVILRYSMIYGPRDRNIFNFFRRARGRFIPLTGKRTIYASMVHVRDAARAAVRALDARIQPGSVYQITDGVRHTLDSVYSYMEDALGKTGKGKRVRIPMWMVMLAAWWNHAVLKNRGISPDQMRQFKALYWFASPGRANKELGWQAEIDIKQGLAETVSWYREQGWLKPVRDP